MADNEIIANSNVPHELVLDIITRVPVKSLLRLMCVSKSFCSIISQPSFAEAHQKKGSSSYFLANFPFQSHQTLITLDLQNKCNNQLARFSSFDYLNDPCFVKLQSLDSVNGLVCLWNNQEDVVVCNPFTKQHTFLPKPMALSDSPLVCCSLGFDPTTKKHKILKSILTKDRTTDWNIFTLGVDESWRKIQCCFRFFPMMNNCCVYSNGVIYSVNYHKFHGYPDNDIAAFSVGEEDFRTVSFPPGVTHTYSCFPSLIEMKGEVALVDHKNLDGDKIVIYVLINYRTSTWTKKQTIEVPLELKQNEEAFSHFRFTSTLEGEIVLVPSLRINSSVMELTYSFMLYYDSRKKGWIKIELCGVGDRNFFEVRDCLWCNIVETIWSVK